MCNVASSLVNTSQHPSEAKTIRAGSPQAMVKSLNSGVHMTARATPESPIDRENAQDTPVRATILGADKPPVSSCSILAKNDVLLECIEETRPDRSMCTRGMSSILNGNKVA